MGTVHSLNCRAIALVTVQEELDLQGLEWIVDATEVEDCSIPAWSMTVGGVAEMWLSDGTADCHCND